MTASGGRLRRQRVGIRRGTGRLPIRADARGARGLPERACADSNGGYTRTRRRGVGSTVRESTAPHRSGMRHGEFADRVRSGVRGNHTEGLSQSGGARVRASDEQDRRLFRALARGEALGKAAMKADLCANTAPRHVGIGRLGPVRKQHASFRTAAGTASRRHSSSACQEHAILLVPTDPAPRRSPEMAQLIPGQALTSRWPR